jgi:hypothetical protein
VGHGPWRDACTCAISKIMRSLATLSLLFALLVSACGSSSSESDAAIDTPSARSTDAADGSTVDAGLGCAALARCVNACTAAPCVAACRQNASADAVRLLQAQVTCVFGAPTATPPVRGACPTAGGGVCDAAAMGYSAAACTACVSAAQGVGGACDAAVVACQRSL